MDLAEALRSLVLEDTGLSRIVLEPGQKPQGPLALGIIDPSIHSLPVSRRGCAWRSGAATSLRSRSSVRSRLRRRRVGCTDPGSRGYLLYGGSVVSDASLALMTTLASGEVPYGMGTHDLRWPFGQTGIGHDGWSMGYLATLETRPDTAITVAVLTSDERLQSGFWGVADLLAEIAVPL